MNKKVALKRWVVIAVVYVLALFFGALVLRVSSLPNKYAVLDRYCIGGVKTLIVTLCLIYFYREKEIPLDGKIVVKLVFASLVCAVPANELQLNLWKSLVYFVSPYAYTCMVMSSIISDFVKNVLTAALTVVAIKIMAKGKLRKSKQAGRSYYLRYAAFTVLLLTAVAVFEILYETRIGMLTNLISLPIILPGTLVFVLWQESNYYEPMNIGGGGASDLPDAVKAEPEPPSAPEANE